MADAEQGAWSLTQEADLRRLERGLKSSPLRLLGRSAAAYRARKRRRARPLPANFPAVVAGAECDPATLATALAAALVSGALDSAGALADRLANVHGTLSGPGAVRARALLLETLIMRGEQARALELGRAHARELSASADGIALLELLELGEPVCWLPDGRINLLACSRRGRWSARALASLTRGKPWLWLRQPELDLLFFSLLQTGHAERGTAFLNRFLATHGLPPCTIAPAADQSQSNVLGRLRFDSVAPCDGGPLVSVLVAARDAAHTVTYSIDSLLAQSYRRLEILIGDDASQDGTAELLRDRYASEARVRLFRSTTRQGTYNVRNALVARARGELLTFHDADDLALPTRIATQVKSMRLPETVGCMTNLARTTSDGRFVFFKNQRATRLCMVSLMLRRTAFDAVGPLRSVRAGADLELFKSLSARFGERAIQRITAPLVFVLSSANSVTRHAGMEALESGYRSPLRRLYSQLVFEQVTPGFTRRSNAEIDALLLAAGNHIDASELLELR